MMNFNEMFPDELDEVIGSPGKYGFGATAILPVGSVEQHGPHMILGCDGYITLATARMTAEKLGAVCFPQLPFSWIGGLRPFPGTIDMRAFITGEYMEKAALEIYRQGFERLAILNSHGGGLEMVFSVARSVYKKTRKITLAMYPSWIWRNWRELREFYATETSTLAGALQYLGRDDLSAKIARTSAEAFDEVGEFEYTREHRAPGLRDDLMERMTVGHDYNHECQHAQPEEKVDIEKGLKTLDFMAEKIAWGIVAAGQNCPT